MRQQKINKMLGNISSSRSYYSTYGKVYSIAYSKVLYIVDIFVPSFKILSLLGFILAKTTNHIFKYVVHNKDNENY